MGKVVLRFGFFLYGFIRGYVFIYEFVYILFRIWVGIVEFFRDCGKWLLSLE